MQDSEEDAAAQQQCDREQVFLTCKLAVAQAIAACRRQDLAFAPSPSSAVKVTVRGGEPGRVEVRGDHSGTVK